MESTRSAAPAQSRPVPTEPQPTSLPPLPLHTERLSLRGLMIDDLDDVHAYQSRPDVARYLYRDPWTLGKTREMLSRASELHFVTEGDQLVLAIELRGSTQVIGEVVLKWASTSARQAEIGYIFNPTAAGRGYATEATRAVIDVAFAHYGFHRVYARLDEENTASAAVCRRLGMRQEARLVDSDIRGEVWGTELIFAVLQSEWRSS